MGVIGRTLLGAATVMTATALTCTEEGVALPLNGVYFCSGPNQQGPQIVDAQNNVYIVQGTGLVAVAAPTAAPVSLVGCPSENALNTLSASMGSPGEFLCAFQEYGYVQQTSTGFLLYRNQNNELDFLVASVSLPLGFSQINDGTGTNLNGPDSRTWVIDVANNYRIRPQVAAAVTNNDSYECPITLMQNTPGLEQFTCDDDAPAYIIGANDHYYVRRSDSEISELQVVGNVAPTGFTWTIAYTELIGPRGIRWNNNINGFLTKTSSNNVGVAVQCNGGFALPVGFRCAGYTYNYILDNDDNYYIASGASTTPVRLEVLRNAAGTGATAPLGFNIVDSLTLSGPAGRLYGFDATTGVLQIISAASETLTVCPENRLPFGYFCAAPNPGSIGSSNGLFGYVIHNTINANNEDLGWNYFTVVRDGYGIETLHPLVAENGNVPAGFTVLPSDAAQGVRLRGPDTVTQGLATDDENVFKIQSNNELANAQGDYNAPNDISTRCADLEEFLNPGYTCAESNGDDYNYVMYEFNYYTISTNAAGSNTLNRLKVLNNVAPAGFTPTNEIGVLSGPEQNGFVYRILSTTRLQYENPNAEAEILIDGGCPERGLPAGYVCPGGAAAQFGYVIGNELLGIQEHEYFFIDRSDPTGPGFIRRLRATGTPLDIPAGFTVTADDNTRLRGPVPNNKVYYVNSDGMLMSEDAPSQAPTVAYFCQDSWLPTEEGSGDQLFSCANTELKPASYCGNYEAPQASNGNQCNAGEFETYPFNSLTEAEREICVQQCTKFYNGIEGGTVYADGNVNGVAIYNVPNAHGYMVGVDYNYYVLEGRHIVRLAVENNEVPAGFTMTAEGGYHGPDAYSTELGWQYMIGADGVLVATGGSVPQATILSNRCSPERFTNVGGRQWSCVEDYSSANAFGYYVRDDATNNLYQVNADERTISQVTIAGSLETAPRGFSFTSATELVGPLGFKYKLSANRKVQYDVSADQPFLAVDFIGMSDDASYCCGECSVNLSELPGSITPTGGFWPITEYPTLIDAAGDGVDFVECLELSAQVSYLVYGNQLRVINDGSLMTVSTNGTPNAPETPSLWPEDKNSAGFYVDPEGFEYNFQYAEINGFSAHVVYREALDDRETPSTP